MEALLEVYSTTNAPSSRSIGNSPTSSPTNGSTTNGNRQVTAAPLVADADGVEVGGSITQQPTAALSTTTATANNTTVHLRVAHPGGDGLLPSVSQKSSRSTKQQSSGLLLGMSSTLTEWSTTTVVGTTMVEMSRENELERRKELEAKRRERQRYRPPPVFRPKLPEATGVLNKATTDSTTSSADERRKPSGGKKTASKTTTTLAATPKKPFNAWDKQLARGEKKRRGTTTSPGGEKRPPTEKEKRIRRLSHMTKKIAEKNREEIKKDLERNALKTSLQPVGPSPQPIKEMARLEQMVRVLAAPARGPKCLPPQQLRMYA